MWKHWMPSSGRRQEPGASTLRHTLGLDWTGLAGRPHCPMRYGSGAFEALDEHKSQDGQLALEKTFANTDTPNQVPELLGTTQNELGIRKWLEDQGHTLVTTDDKEGENSTFDKELVDAEIIITTP